MTHAKIAEVREALAEATEITKRYFNANPSLAFDMGQIAGHIYKATSALDQLGGEEAELLHGAPDGDGGVLGYLRDAESRLALVCKCRQETPEIAREVASAYRAIAIVLAKLGEGAP